jgi:Chorismate synthase
LPFSILEEKGIRIAAHISSVGSVRDRSFNPLCISDDEIEAIRGRSIPVLSDGTEKEITEYVSRIRSEGDSVGGTIECAVTGLEPGIGDALFDGLESSLSSIVLPFPE